MTTQRKQIYLKRDAASPEALNVPKEPTEEERELHNLTHMPYRAWCPLCVKCKGAGDYHKQYYDKKPVVQVDYSFVTQKLPADGESKGKTLSATVLSAVDITTGMVSSCIVKEKGSSDYAINELQRFVLEVARSQGVLQSDQEPAIKLLCRDVATKIGMTTRLSPVNSKQSQGIVERWRR